MRRANKALVPMRWQPAHGYPRATMDIDIWVMPSPQNAEAVLRALRRFGAPLHNLTKEDLQKDGTIFHN